jgi:hypothetical protein
MKVASLAPLLLFSLLLAGCIGTSVRPLTPYQSSAGETFTYRFMGEEKMSVEGLQIMRERLDMQLEAAGLRKSGAGPTREVDIVINNYFMRHGAARAMGGILAGIDNILTTVVVKDSTTQTVLSKFEVESKNPSAWATSRGLIQGHADKIVNYLKTGQSQ